MVILVFDPFTLNEMLREHGRAVTLTSKREGFYNPVTGDFVRGTTDYLVQGKFYNDVPEMTENNPNTYGTKRAVIKGTLLNGLPTPQPKVQDVISYTGGSPVAITKVSPITASAVVVCYLLHLDE